MKMTKRQLPEYVVLPGPDDDPMMFPVIEAPSEVHNLFTRARARGISIRSLCQRAGVHHDVVGRWRRGETGPTFRTMRKLVDALDAMQVAA
jgi:predicted transcriptional regulator